MKATTKKRNGRASSRSSRAAAEEVYRLKITLAGVSPPIWRRVEVPGRFTLGDLHHVIQAVMPWDDDHLHRFRAGNEVYVAVRDGEAWDGSRDEEEITLAAVARRRKRFGYRYDFGDAWEHEVAVEGHAPAERGTRYPRCLDGARAAPPEDCGGEWGYRHLLAVLADPSHKDHEETMAWAGRLDPERFDRDAATRALARRWRAPTPVPR